MKTVTLYWRFQDCIADCKIVLEIPLQSFRSRDTASKGLQLNIQYNPVFCTLTYLRLGYTGRGVELIVEKYKKEQEALENAKQNDQESASAIFAKYLDSSSKMTIPKFREIVQTIAPSITPERLEELVKEVDKNGDGDVDMSEFIDMWSANKFSTTVAHEKGEEHEDLTTRAFLR